MARMREKGCPCFHRSQMTTFAFDTQILLDVTKLSNQAHQSFRLMSVELISKKEPVGLRIGLERLGNMSGEVGFGTRRPQARRDNLTSSHIQVGNQALCAMSLLFEFLPLDMSRQHGQTRMQSL